MHPLVEIISAETTKLLPNGAALLVAVSGGVDSVCLLRLLHSLATERGWHLGVVHVDHSLRGEESRGDARFVRELASTLNLPYFETIVDVAREMEVSETSVETSARTLRHQAFASIALEHQFTFVALGHHADDQVETFFIRLLRGSSPHGLAGIMASNPSPANPDLRIVRPLLKVRRPAIEDYARENGIQFRVDSSNASPEHLRNRFRTDLIPTLHNYQPALTDVILRTMRMLEEQAEALQTYASLPGSMPFNFLPIALQRLKLEQQLIQNKLRPSFDLIEQLLTRPGQWIAVAPDRFVQRNQLGELLFRSPQATFADREEFQIVLEAPGEATLGSSQLRWDFRNGNDWRGLPLGSEAFDQALVGAVVTLRHWKEGDRFTPCGMSAPTKLKHQFANQKFDSSQKHSAWLAQSPTGIFWVEGLRISEQFKVTPATTRMLFWQWTPATP